jgi:NADH:ubiquinone oxidoreductase subunit 5 (subunit L)/multisubunit Na+/H+ antiporter MnhA subunit
MKAFLLTRGGALILWIGLFLLVSNTSALACAACYGDTSGSKMSDAASVGIFAMVVIMFAMLGAVAAFGWHLAYRAKHPLPDYEELLSEGDGEMKPGTTS